jgi:hypothetical protein
MLHNIGEFIRTGSPGKVNDSTRRWMQVLCLAAMAFSPGAVNAADDPQSIAFFEKKIRPILIRHCYECHSEDSKEQQGGLLLDRRSGWLKGGDTEKAVVPGDPEASLLIRAVRYEDEDLQMPPESKLSIGQIRLLEQWVRRGASGPADDLGDTAFSRLGDQKYLFGQAADHWAFQPVNAVDPPEVGDSSWNSHAIDRFVFSNQTDQQLTPSPMAGARALIRRLSYDLTGLPPTPERVEKFASLPNAGRGEAVRALVDDLIASRAFGEHFGRMWLDVARYADTDSFYRPDTKTPHYFPFAFTYRDYVIEAFNSDKRFDQFVREQLAADLLGLEKNAPELAALGFLTVGPHANRNQTEAIDDWIDTTTRGLLGLTVACARCHDHKFEPIPTADYYSLHGVFASVNRINPLAEEQLPVLAGYVADEDTRADYAEKRAEIDKKIKAAGKKVAGGNRRSVAQKIRETELAELLLFHPGAPAHTMVVRERPKAVEPVVFLRGDPANRGESVPRRFLRILDPGQLEFSASSSGRLDLANRIVDPDNPLTARVFVNRVWGFIMGGHLVETPSDFGLQGSGPSHPLLLDWLAADFVRHDWSLKHLVRTIVLSRTYQQSSDHREDMATLDSQNRYYWRANRKRLSIEELRDSSLAVSGQLDRTSRGRPERLWGKDYTRRRAIYGYINRFNLDPTLRIFDFPTPMQTQPERDESIVAPQALFTMNSPFVIDQANAITQSGPFAGDASDSERVAAIYQAVFQRKPHEVELNRIIRFVELLQKRSAAGARISSPWPLVAQSLLMSNEFQYID